MNDLGDRRGEVTDGRGAADDLLRTISFGHGGLLRRLERVLRLSGADERRVWLRRTSGYVGLVYAPVLLLAMVHHLLTGEWLVSVTRVHTHVTALVSLPLLFASEVIADRYAKIAFASVIESGIVAEDQLPRLRAIVEAHARRRDSFVVELVLLAIVAGLFGGRVGLTGVPVTGWWQAIVAVTAYRFLLLRWLWRWVLWGRLLFDVSRLPLRLAPTHADRVGGISQLISLSEIPFALFTAAVASAAAAGVGDRWRIDPSVLETLPMEAGVLGGVAVVIATIPLLAFAPDLARARKLGLQRYGALVHRHDLAFAQRWIGHPAGALGSPDMSSLADLGTGFGRVADMRALMVSTRLFKLVLAGAWIPLAPLAVAHFGLANVVKRLIELVA